MVTETSDLLEQLQTFGDAESHLAEILIKQLNEFDMDKMLETLKNTFKTGSLIFFKFRKSSGFFFGKTRSANTHFFQWVYGSMDSDSIGRICFSKQL